MSAEKAARGATGALGLGAFAMLIACLAGPAALGALTSGVLGGWIGVAAAVVVATVAALVIAGWRRRRGTAAGGC